MKLIPKYQNAGLVARQDNTYVAKPIIPPKLIKRTYTPTQSYVSQDNRSGWQRKQDSKKADEEYKKYMEDKKMQQGLENLNGFLNFVDAATIATGVGSAVGKGLRWGGKKAANQLVKRKIDSYGINPTFHTTPNDPNVNTFRLMKERLHNGGFDRLDQHGSHKFTDEAKKHILNSKPELVDSKILGNEPGGSVYRKGYFVNRDELDKRTTYQVLDIGSHELAHYIYRPNYKESLRLAESVPQKFNDKNMAAYFTKNGATEQSARGTQLKNYFGFNRGEQNITPEMWEYAKKNYVKDTGIDNNMTEWFNSVPNEYVPQFLDWLNDNAPTLAVPITVGIGLNNE